MAKTDLVLRNVKGTPVTHSELDANLDRLMYWSGAWAAGTYTANEVVSHSGVLWIAVQTTTEEPSGATSHWEYLAGVGEYGRGEVSTSSTKNYPDITATWQPINLWDSVTVPAFNCTIDTAGTFTFGLAKWWEANLSITVSHNELNAVRTLLVRAFNITKGVAGQTFSFGTGKDTTITNVNISDWANVTPGEIGDSFRVEWSHGGAIDDYSSVQVSNAVLRIVAQPG